MTTKGNQKRPADELMAEEIRKAESARCASLVLLQKENRDAEEAEKDWYAEMSDYFR